VCKVDYELERNRPAPSYDEWWGADGENHGQLTGVFRLDGGWACTLWLIDVDDAWDVGGVILHAAADEVPIGPVRRGPDGEPFRMPTTADVRATTPGRPNGAVTTRLLRELPLGRMAAELRTYQHDDFSPRHPEIAEALATRPGRRGQPDSFYARVAAAYVALVEAGSTSPVKALAERETYTTSNVNNWLREARNRGLLTEARVGKAGGRLTDKGRAVLAEEEVEG
jgi:DNA-binding MarR family transcriptional regulator